MPAPTKAQIRPIVDGLFSAKGFIGENIKDLADVLAESIAITCSIFMSQGKVAPGIPVVAPPPTFSGSTVGPGNLVFPPTKAQIKPIIDGLFSAKGFTGENIKDLADVLADTLSRSMEMFVAQVKVAPGIAITGGVTVSPGILM